MRDYAEQIERLRECASNNHEVHSKCGAYLSGVCAKTRDIRMQDAADAIEELLAVCREIAAFVIRYADDDEVSAEVLCRKLHKIGVIEKDGAWWTLPEPPKEAECSNCKHNPPSNKFPCVDCDMRYHDRLEPKEVER